MKSLRLLFVPVRPHQVGLFCARQNNSFLTQRVALVATVLCLAFSAIPTRAQTSPAEAPQPAAEAASKLETLDKAIELAPFEVKGTTEKDGYAAATTSSSGRIQQQYLDVPQTVSVVTSQFINDFNIQDSLHLMSTLSNVTFGLPNNPSLMSIRGATISTSYVDGVPLALTGSYAQPLQFFDRVEVVRGPSSVAFGQGVPGGLINKVSKTPQGINSGKLTVGTGAYDNYLANFDVQGVSKKNPKLKYRAVGFWEEGGYMEEGLRHKGVGAQLALKYDYDRNTAITLITSFDETTWPRSSGQQTLFKDPVLNYIYYVAQSGNRRSYLPGTVFSNGAVFGVSGTPPAPGTQGPAGLPVFGTGAYLPLNASASGANWRRDNTEAYRTSLYVTKKIFEESIYLRGAYVHTSARQNFRNQQFSSFDSQYNVPLLPPGDWAQWQKAEGRNNANAHRFELDALAKAQFLGGTWSALVGGSYDFGDGKSYQALLPIVDPKPGLSYVDSRSYVNLYNPGDIYVTELRTVSVDNESKNSGTAGYFSLDAKFFDERIVLSYGLRKDWFESTTTNLRTGVITDTGKLVSAKNGTPRYAIMVKPLKWLSVYAMQAEQSDPVQSNFKYFIDAGSYNSLTAAQRQQYPLDLVQYYTPGGITKEVGLKMSLLNNRLFVSATAFRSAINGQVSPRALPTITNADNSTTVVAERFILATTASGLEVEVGGRLSDRFVVSANYGITRGYFPDFRTGGKQYLAPPATINFRGKYDFSNSSGEGLYVTFGGMVRLPYLIRQADTFRGFDASYSLQNKSISAWWADNAVYVRDERTQWSADGGIGYKWKNKGGLERRLYLSSTNMFNELVTVATVTPQVVMPFRKVTLTYTMDF